MLLDPLLLTAAGAATVVTSTVLHAPQLARVHRQRDAAGLAPASLLSGLVQYAAWNVYAWQGQAWSVLVSNLVATVLFVALAAAAWCAGLRPDRACWLPTAWTPVVVAGALHGPGAFALALTVGSALTLAPSVLTAWTAPRTTGLSVSSWVLCLVNGALFWLLGLGGAPVGVLAYGVLATVASGLVLLAVALRSSARLELPVAVTASPETAATDFTPAA
ncbi:hypothetical protein [Nocardioides perillae]|uniref:Uncharacterized protein with PQ loop repeat n=1 Tax=Nocardioides perillae TaxID=1119534 RepID=A0A7Y9RV86_9ACTN|nr:hypothetical protein [Nocardioides perillae]NYG55981.1 uncharacterized protein with PQ loop repeat [Nocardioides perillae]